MAAEIDRISFSKEAKAAELLGQLYLMAQQHPDSISLKRECIYHEAILKYEQGIYDSSLTYRIEKELNKIDKEKDLYHKALLQYSLVINQYTKGGYDNAFAVAFNAVEIFKKINDSLLIAKSLMLLGRICIFIESPYMAEDYYIQAQNYINASQLEYYQSYSSIVYIRYVLHNRLDEALSALLPIIPVITKFDEGFVASTYLNIGKIYHMKKDYEKAHEYFMLAKNIGKSIDNIRFSVALYQNLGVYYLSIQDYKTSYKYFHTAQSFAKQSKNPDLILSILDALSYIHKEFNNIDSAYYYLSNYQTLFREVNKNINPSKAYQAYITTYLDASKKEIIIKEQEIMLKNRRFFVLLTTSIGIILLIASGLIILQLQKRHIRQQSLLKEVENNELKERLDSKQQLEQLQRERIETQNREMTSYSLALANKNNLLQQIALAIQKLPDDQPASNEVRQIIKNNLNTDKVWDDFVLHFERVHPSFFHHIKSFNADLSENDLRLCAYFRIGMSAKQIAQILNISPESIKTLRHRIKKKLGLLETEKLDDFIRNI